MAVSARRLSASEAVAQRQQRVRDLESEMAQWEREFEAQRARRVQREQRRGCVVAAGDELSNTDQHSGPTTEARASAREARLRREREAYEAQRRETLDTRTRREEELRLAAEREADEQRRAGEAQRRETETEAEAETEALRHAADAQLHSRPHEQARTPTTPVPAPATAPSPAPTLAPSPPPTPALPWRVSHVVEESDVRVGAGADAGYDVALLARHFAAQGRVSAAFALQLVARATVLLRAEANVLRVTAPCVVVGDVHGQLYDVLELLRVAGPLCATQYVFLGDYVDRGAFSLETLLLLLSAKVTAPQRVWLLRGNHETRAMNQLHSFAREVAHKLRTVPDAYAAFATLFDALPLAAVVQWSGGDVLCVHGGLSQSAPTLAALQDIVRTCEPEDDSALLDVLWADPLPESAPAQLWKENTKRGCGSLFGYDALSSFLEDNALTLLVRAHQVQPQGYEERWYRQWNPDARTPKLITLFSAPNYCDKYGNLGAVLRLDATPTYALQTFAWQPHPYVLPDFASALEYSLPFVAEQTLHFLLAMMKLLHGVDLDDERAQEAAERQEQQEQQQPQQQKEAASEGRLLREAVRAMLRVKLWRRERQASLVPALPAPATLALAQGVHEAHTLRRAQSSMPAKRAQAASSVPRRGMRNDERRAWFEAVCAEDEANERLVRDDADKLSVAATAAGLRRTHSSRF